MNERFFALIATGKRLAEEWNLRWDLAYDANGRIDPVQRWNLTILAGMVPPPTVLLPAFAYDAKMLRPLNTILVGRGCVAVSDIVMPKQWQELLKAVVLYEVLLKKNGPFHAVNTVGRLIRGLASCASGVEPWDITGEHVQLAYNAALLVGTSGKRASVLEGVVRTLFDGMQLAERSPLARFCRPYPSDLAKAAHARVGVLKLSVNAHQRPDAIRGELQERKSGSKLPEQEAFWELVRIVFTERPLTLSDALRFIQVKLLIVTGWRIGEIVMLPLDWSRQREYVDMEGRPAGVRGGISTSLMIRYFVSGACGPR